MLLIDCWIFYKMLEWIWTYELQLIFCYHISCCLWAVTIHNAMITVYNFVNYFPMIVFEKINVAGSNCVYGVMNVTSSCRLKKRANVQYYTNIWSLWSTAIHSECFLSYPIKKTYIAIFYGIVKLINVMTANIISKVKHTDAFINTDLLR